MIAIAIGGSPGAHSRSALIIGRLAIRHISIERTKLRALEIEDLRVTRMRVAEVMITDTIKLPDTGNREIVS